MKTIKLIPQALHERIQFNNCLVKVSIRQCNFKIMAYLPEHPGRRRVEKYIADIYSKHYKANINDFHPLLITIERPNGNIIAALGIRFADHQKLFAEEYSHENIENLFTENLKVDSNRKQTIEIGNLASSHNGYAKFLFVAMTKILFDWHFQWITFTAVPAVINVFRKLKLNPVEVCSAHISNLKHSSSDWGEYYQHSPKVMLGDIGNAHKFLQQLDSYQRINFQWV